MNAKGFNLTSTSPTTPHLLLSAGLLPRIPMMWNAAPTPPSTLTPPPPSATALPPRSPPPMQSRPAAERPNRLSLLPLVQDLDEAAAGQPAAPPPPSGPKSEMEWDEEEAPPRAQEKVRELFRQVLNRREKHTAAMAAARAMVRAKGITMAMAKTKAKQQADHSVTSTTGHTSALDPDEKIKRGGSIQNARRGIAERRKLEVSFPHPKCATSFTDMLPALQLASVRRAHVASCFRGPACTPTPKDLC
jgi:hypothetical protein